MFFSFKERLSEFYGPAGNTFMSKVKVHVFTLKSTTCPSTETSDYLWLFQRQKIVHLIVRCIGVCIAKSNDSPRNTHWVHMRHPTSNSTIKLFQWNSAKNPTMLNELSPWFYTQYSLGWIHQKLFSWNLSVKNILI